MRSSLKLVLFVTAIGFYGSAFSAPVLNSNDFISSPALFNGFENIPNDGTFFTGGAGPYSEGGISVRQINGDPGNDIWVTIAQSPSLATEGNYAWYPNGGDNGYTQITRVGGFDFSDISLIFRAFGSGNVLYDLLDDGVSVLSGEYAYQSGLLGRIGFQGGGFDEVRLRSGPLGSDLYDGSHNALDIDSIKSDGQSVPEPASVALLGIALAGIGAVRRKKPAQ